jgi:hypothetical protein
MEHPTEGTLRSVRTPTLFGATPSQPPTPAPLVGQHTDEVLREAGFSEDAIAQLESRGVIARTTL